MRGRRSRIGWLLLAPSLLLCSPYFSVAQDASEMTTIAIISELLQNLNERTTLLDERESLFRQTETSLNERGIALEQIERSLTERLKSLDERESSLLEIASSWKSSVDALNREIRTWKWVAAGSAAGAIAILIALAVR